MTAQEYAFLRNLRHEISGIAYELSTIGTPVGIAIEAWSAYQNHESPLVVADTKNCTDIPIKNKIYEIHKNA